MPDHPLQQTLVRARLLSEYLKPELGTPTGVGWVGADDFAPGAAWFDTLVAATQARLRTTARAVVGSAILQGYQWPLMSTAIACFLLDRRVPDLSTTNTRIHYNPEHEGDALALRNGRFAALPDDPAADHPDVTVVPDVAALRDVLRTGIEAHLGSLIDQICGRLGGKPRGLWLNVSDSCAGTLVWLMQEQHPLINLPQIEVAVDALIRTPGSPLNNRQIGLLPVAYQERSRVFLSRATCCYWYKTEGGDYCATCPHRTPQDRRERLLKYVAEQHQTQVEMAHEEVAA